MKFNLENFLQKDIFTAFIVLNNNVANKTKTQKKIDEQLSCACFGHEIHSKRN